MVCVQAAWMRVWPMSSVSVECSSNCRCDIRKVDLCTLLSQFESTVNFFLFVLIPSLPLSNGKSNANQAHADNVVTAGSCYNTCLTTFHHSTCFAWTTMYQNLYAVLHENPVYLPVLAQ